MVVELSEKEYIKKHWIRKNGTEHWAAFPKEGEGIGGHWIKEPGKPLEGHIDLRKDGKKIARY